MDKVSISLRVPAELAEALKTKSGKVPLATYIHQLLEDHVLGAATSTDAVPATSATRGSDAALGRGLAMLIDLANTANEWRGEVTVKQDRILQLLDKIDARTQLNTETAAEHDQLVAERLPEVPKMDDLLKQLRDL